MLSFVNTQNISSILKDDVLKAATGAKEGLTTLSRPTYSFECTYKTFVRTTRYAPYSVKLAKLIDI